LGLEAAGAETAAFLAANWARKAFGSLRSVPRRAFLSRPSGVVGIMLRSGRAMGSPARRIIG
jgi:hypothetical protein